MYDTVYMSAAQSHAVTDALQLVADDKATVPRPLELCNKFILLVPFKQGFQVSGTGS